MDKNTKLEIKQQIEQYKLEAQNKELLTQIKVAKETIANQNKHIENLFTEMSWTIGILGVMLAIFGIIIPLIMTALSIKNKIELNEIKNNVDDFITRKFIEWENQNTDDIIDKYINGDIRYAVLSANLKGRQMSYSQMEKVFNSAKNKVNSDQDCFDRCMGLLIYHLFEDKKDIVNEDFDKVRKLIIGSGFFYALALTRENGSRYVEIVSSLEREEQKNKMLDLLTKSEDKNLASVLDVMKRIGFIPSEAEQIIVKKLIKTKCSFALKQVQDNQNIIDRLFEQNEFNDATIILAIGNASQIQLNWRSAFNINKDSYLGLKLQEEKEMLKK